MPLTDTAVKKKQSLGINPSSSATAGEVLALGPLIVGVVIRHG
ncbi:hypothetical protein [Polaromonas sp. JS666]|nr:hypothetical protein [Polaromonas sp. JS666]